MHLLRTLCILLLLVSYCPSIEAASAAKGTSFGEIINTDLARGKTGLCAVRDDYGFLWVGTSTGLCCFDGNGRPVAGPSADVIASTEGLYISALFNHDDDVWYGGTPGLAIFNRRTNTSSPFPYSTRYGVTVSSPVQKIADVGNGRIWILTHGQGFFVFNEADSTLIQNSRNGAFFSDMAIGRNGTVHTVNFDGLIQSFNSAGNLVNSVSLPEYKSDKNTVCIVASGDDVWVSSHRSIYHYNTETRKVNLISDQITPSEINSLLTAADGYLLLGTDDGIWRFNTVDSSAERLTPNRQSGLGIGLRDDHVSEITYDSDSSLIVVTPNGGVSHILRENPIIKTIPLAGENDPRNRVNSLATTPDKHKIIAGTENGLVLYDPISDKVTTPVPSLGSGVEISSIEWVGDTVWIGSVRNGLYRYNPSTGNLKHYTYDPDVPYGLISNDIKKIYHTRYGEVFILTGWGICRYNSKWDDFRVFPEIDSHTPFITMQEDRHGNLWTSTSGNGLHRRVSIEEGFRPFHSRSIGGRTVSLMLLDSRGNFWVATQDHSVFVFDENEGDFVPVDIAMAKEYPITFMEEDSEENIWVGTHGGLAKIDPNRKISYYSFRSDADFTPGTDASQRLFDGRIMVASGKGLWQFIPAEMKGNSQLVNVYIHSLDFPYHDDSKSELDKLGLNILLYTRDEIRLPYTDNTFTLCLSATHTSSTPNVRYDYMLEGVDKTWIHAAGSEVTYTDLAPGTYRFLLKPNYGTDAQIRELTIIILPPWYRTWFAYTIYTILLLVLVFYLFLLSRRRIQDHYRNRLNTLRMQKEHEMYEAKMRFFVNLVHEIRTPLTLISIPLEQMADNAKKGAVSTEENMKHIKSMRRNVNYLLGIINQLLDFRKAEDERDVRLSCQRLDMNDIVSDIASRFEHPLATTGKKIVLNLPPVHVYAWVDPEKIDRVIMNIIGNATKYSRSVVRIILEEPENGVFSIVVSDDGPGVPAGERERIFDTYYQIEGDNVAATLGTGLGLAYAKLVVKAHGGGISVRDGDGGGAEFVITLPVKEAVGVTQSESISEVEAVVSTGEEKKLKVLLVDDNKDLLQTVTEALEDTYELVTAKSGEQAFEILERHNDFDVIISDFMMPGISGAELCRKVKGDMRFSHIPFIILTAKTDSEAKVEGMECGADVYMEKPFSIRQLKLQILNIMHTRELFYARMNGAGVIAAPVEVETEVAKEESFLNKLDAEFLNSLNDYIRANIVDEEFSIDLMANQMNMSRSTFYRKLKAVTGMTPVDYLKNFRLDYSATLLMDGVRVTEVAVMAGFTSSSYFAKCFKAKFGMIPKEYVASRRKAENGD